MKEIKDIVEIKKITDVSKKTNRPYSALEIKFPNGYRKLVFLQASELYMIEDLMR